MDHKILATMQFRSESDAPGVCSFIAKHGGSVEVRSNPYGTKYYVVVSRVTGQEWLLAPSDWVVAVCYGGLGTMTDEMYRKCCPHRVTA